MAAGENPERKKIQKKRSKKERAIERRKTNRLGDSGEMDVEGWEGRKVVGCARRKDKDRQTDREREKKQEERGG